MRVGLPEASHVTDKSSKAQRADKARGAHRYSARAGLTPASAGLIRPATQNMVGTTVTPFSQTEKLRHSAVLQGPPGPRRS